jgi:hypothetical protein
MNNTAAITIRFGSFRIRASRIKIMATPAKISPGIPLESIINMPDKISIRKILSFPKG